MEAPANIQPLAEPRSSSGSTVQASASMATSCVAPKQLCRKMIAVNRLTCVTKSTLIAASSVAIMPSCIRKIHSRRRPKRSEESVSTNGPIAHLKPHGRYSEPTNRPISAGPSPPRRICAAMAVAVKPSGMPSVT